jgi:hypothetical protein
MLSSAYPARARPLSEDRAAAINLPDRPPGRAEGQQVDLAARRSSFTIADAMKGSLLAELARAGAMPAHSDAFADLGAGCGR